jgi:DNA-binding NarL/FixJ family response regulator
VRVVIAEDHALLRYGLTRILQAFDFHVVAAVDNGPDLLPTLITHKHEVAVIDVRLPPTFTALRHEPGTGRRLLIRGRNRVGHSIPQGRSSRSR